MVLMADSESGGYTKRRIIKGLTVRSKKNLYTLRIASAIIWANIRPSHRLIIFVSKKNIVRHVISCDIVMLPCGHSTPAQTQEEYHIKEHVDVWLVVFVSGETRFSVYWLIFIDLHPDSAKRSPETWAQTLPNSTIWRTAILIVKCIRTYKISAFGLGASKRFSALELWSQRICIRPPIGDWIGRISGGLTSHHHAWLRYIHCSWIRIGV